MSPRAPQLLAAVLDRSGCDAGLLPLLAEAAAAALRGLSVTARRAHPSASAPFLQVQRSPAHCASSHLSRALTRPDSKLVPTDAPDHWNDAAGSIT
jgi:hypothetical protein